jgi:hypothetical protein
MKDWRGVDMLIYKGYHYSVWINSDVRFESNVKLPNGDNMVSTTFLMGTIYDEAVQWVKDAIDQDRQHRDFAAPIVEWFRS